MYRSAGILGVGLIAACGALDGEAVSLTCDGCLPSCAVDIDPDDLEGSAKRLGCDPELVLSVTPWPGFVSYESRPEVSVELSRPLRMKASGSGCDGPIRLSRVAPVGQAPAYVAADIITHASLNSLPLWPRHRDCVEARWSAHGTTLRLQPMADLEEFVWYEVSVDATLPIAGDTLCSQLLWRFTVSPCGNGVVDVAESFTDWVCLGRVEAERGWFNPYDEDCDDGNRRAHDGCSHLCVDETGWSCDEDGCRTRCGDAIKAGDEECDYGIHPPEGCDDCRVVDGFECGWNGCSPESQASEDS
ncbi:MAG: hypothetical protein OEZ06_00990 [Myxococcales bacterium]|nr:hypothetical protein [Myxococcales bacterium]